MDRNVKMCTSSQKKRELIWKIDIPNSSHSVCLFFVIFFLLFVVILCEMPAKSDLFEYNYPLKKNVIQCMARAIQYFRSMHTMVMFCYTKIFSIPFEMKLRQMCNRFWCFSDSHEIAILNIRNEKETDIEQHLNVYFCFWNDRQVM